MKIVIKEKVVDYPPDFPEGWFFSAGDPFKFPVMLKGTPCFIKRFERKNPSTISGWELLQKMRGKNIPNLPRLFDISENMENGKTIQYVFYQYMQGKTFDKIRAVNNEQDLANMRDGIFCGFEAIHQMGYWVVDFCEKNIFRDPQGIYSIIDIDSMYRLSERPRIDMYGSKEYWALVIDFYKQVCKRSDITVSHLPGASFNYLQSLFLLLRLKLGLSWGAGANVYGDQRLYGGLPMLLYEVLPDSKEFFLKAINPQHLSFSQEEINQLKYMSEQIITKEIGRDRSAGRPVETSVTPTETTGGGMPSPLSIDDVSKKELQSAIGWARFIAILGFIVTGGLFLASFPFAKDIASNASDSVNVIIASIISTIVSFFPLYFLMQFAVKMKQALEKNTKPALQGAFRNIRYYFIYCGVCFGLLVFFSIVLFLSKLH